MAIDYHVGLAKAWQVLLNDHGESLFDRALSGQVSLQMHQVFLISKDYLVIMRVRQREATPSLMLSFETYLRAMVHH